MFHSSAQRCRRSIASGSDRVSGAVYSRISFLSLNNILLIFWEELGYLKVLFACFEIQAFEMLPTRIFSSPQAFRDGPGRSARLDDSTIGAKFSQRYEGSRNGCFEKHFRKDSGLIISLNLR